MSKKLYVIQNSKGWFLDGFRQQQPVWIEDLQKIDPHDTFVSAFEDVTHSGGSVVAVRLDDSCVLKIVKERHPSPPRTLKGKVKSMRESLQRWPSRHQAWVTDKFEGIILYASYQNMPCGCAVTGNGTLIHPLTIKPCKKHTKIFV